jgi:pimeloyl-ACP methyl ester carboxylesterase
MMRRSEKRGAAATTVLAGARLVGDGVEPIAGVVEGVHAAIARPWSGPSGSARGRTRGIARVAYGAVRRIARLVQRGLRVVPPRAGDADPPRERRAEAVRAALNGVLGHHLTATRNALAIDMVVRRDGRALALEGAALRAQVAQPSRRLLLLVHGLCMNDLQWEWRGFAHGESLAHELDRTALYLHYNSGLHISTNGRALAELLEGLCAVWPVPVEEVAIVGHSMGGMVARSACHYASAAGYAWRGRLRKLVFLATPHHGAPLERGGNRFESSLAGAPLIAPFARLGRVRSAGITDLRYGNLIDEDWRGSDRFRPAGDTRTPLPLPSGVDCYAIAATHGRREADLRDRLLGDGLVRLDSALGEHADPARALAFGENRRWIAYETSHFGLLRHAGAHARMKEWLGEGAS